MEDWDSIFGPFGLGLVGRKVGWNVNPNLLLEVLVECISQCGVDVLERAGSDENGDGKERIDQALGLGKGLQEKG